MYNKYFILFFNFLIYFSTSHASFLNFLINPFSNFWANQTSDFEMTDESKLMTLNLSHPDLSNLNENKLLYYPYISLLIDNVNNFSEPVKQEVWKSLTSIDDKSKNDWEKIRQKLAQSELEYELIKKSNDSSSINFNSNQHSSNLLTKILLRKHLEKNLQNQTQEVSSFNHSKNVETSFEKNETGKSGYLFHSQLAEQLYNYHRMNLNS